MATKISSTDINNLKKKVQLKRDEIMQAKGNKEQLLKEMATQKALLKTDFGIDPEEIQETLEKIQKDARTAYERIEDIVNSWEG